MADIIENKLVTSLFRALVRAEHAPHEVRWVGQPADEHSDGFAIGFHAFLELADRLVPDESYIWPMPCDLVAVGDDWWLQLGPGGMDGYHWMYREQPKLGPHPLPYEDLSVLRLTPRTHQAFYCPSCSYVVSWKRDAMAKRPYCCPRPGCGSRVLIPLDAPAIGDREVMTANWASGQEAAS